MGIALFEMCYKKEFHFDFTSYFKVKCGPYENKITIPRPELLGNLSRLTLTVLNSFQEKLIFQVYMRSLIQVSLAWIKSYNKEIVTFVQNQFVKI